MKIRARGWHTVSKVMFSPEEMAEDQLTLMPDGSGFINVSSISTKLSQPIPQMIPLLSSLQKDKEGKEVFEGDILDVDSENRLVIVTWFEPQACFDTTLIKILDKTWPFSKGLQTSEWYFRCKVVGNIYENPELTK